MTNLSKSYLKAVKKALGKSDENKQQLLSDLTSDVEAYLSAHPDADRVALEQEFGSPEAFALQFTDGKELSSLRRKKNRWVVWMVIAIILLALLGWVIYEICLYGHSRGSYTITNDYSSGIVSFDVPK